jgi:hypothetical protein
MNTARTTRRHSASAVVCLACAISTVPAMADGIAFKGLDLQSLLPAAENEQIAAISHRDGVERMIIAVDFDAEADERAVWVFPVPGAPDAVHVEIQDTFPRLFGFDPRTRAGVRIEHLMLGLRAWQIYPLLLEGLFLLPHLGGVGDVAVFESTEKWGIRIETVRSGSLTALADYLRSEDTHLAEEQLATLEPYLAGDHTLVVAWIASVAELRAEFPKYDARRSHLSGRSPCLYVEFPTERAFYPLRPTSAYGDLEIPLRVYVLGFVDCQTAAAVVADELRPHHYLASGHPDAEEMSFFTGLAAGEFDYTVFRGSVRARDFIDDIWFAPAWPVGMRYADALLSVGFAGGFLPVLAALLVAVSYVSGGLAGLVTIRKWSIPAKVGCWNVLTLVGLHVTLRYRSLTGEPGGTQRRLRGQYVLAFTAIFVLLSFVLQVLVQLPLIVGQL